MNKIPGNVLTIRVAAEETMVPLNALLRVLKATLSILHDIDEKMSSEGRHTLRWQISEVSDHSPLSMTIVGEPVYANDFSIGVAIECLEGLGRLEQGLEPALTFPETAMKGAKRLTMVHNEGISSVVFSAPDRQPVEPTQHLAANVDAILKRRFRAEQTTLDGTLEAVDAHEGLNFFIYDQVTAKGVRCSFGEELFDEARSSIRSRVSVTGLVRFNRSGRPVSMKVESMRQFRSAADLPTFPPGDRVRITNGISSEEYVRRMRDAE